MRHIVLVVDERGRLLMQDAVMGAYWEVVGVEINAASDKYEFIPYPDGDGASEKERSR